MTSFFGLGACRRGRDSLRQPKRRGRPTPCAGSCNGMYGRGGGCRFGCWGFALVRRRAERVPRRCLKPPQDTLSSRERGQHTVRSALPPEGIDRRTSRRRMRSASGFAASRSTLLRCASCAFADTSACRSSTTFAGTRAAICRPAPAARSSSTPRQVVALSLRPRALRLATHVQCWYAAACACCARGARGSRTRRRQRRTPPARLAGPSWTPSTRPPRVPPPWSAGPQRPQQQPRRPQPQPQLQRW